MAPSGRIDYLKAQLASQIEGFERGRRDNKSKALRFKLAIVTLGSLTTILLGLQGLGYETALHNLALLFSASVTLLSSWDAFYNHRGLWVRYTGTVMELRAIRSRLEYLLADTDREIEESQIDALYDQFQTTLNETNAWWQQERRSVASDRES